MPQDTSSTMSPSPTVSNTAIFNTFEICGIAIATLFFLIGFPGNILSIVVCLKSMCHKYFRIIRMKKNRRFQNKDLDNVQKRLSPYQTRKLSNVLPNCNQNNNHLQRNSDENGIILLDRNYNNRPELKRISFCNHSNPLASNSRARTTIRLIKTIPPTTEFNIRKSMDNGNRQLVLNRSNTSLLNPHRKCFEMYLIEISFCDLIIIGYNFTEWTLLILSKLHS